MSRPSFKASREQRKLVRSLAALGTPQEQIVTTIGLRSPKTLRKHFGEEIRRGTAEASAAVASVAYEMATSGKWPATRYWIRAVAFSSEPASDVDPEDFDIKDWNQ